MDKKFKSLNGRIWTQSRSQFIERNDERFQVLAGLGQGSSWKALNRDLLIFQRNKASNSKQGHKSIEKRTN